MLDRRRLIEGADNANERGGEFKLTKKSGAKK
jgi:hypothetical protein